MKRRRNNKDTVPNPLNVERKEFILSGRTYVTGCNSWNQSGERKAMDLSLMPLATNVKCLHIPAIASGGPGDDSKDVKVPSHHTISKHK